MQKFPLVSVIIPSYNRANVIAETIDSVISQDYPNWECIIVDDGSNDNTLELISELYKSESRIKLLSRNRLPKGANTCRNIGLEVAVGSYIMFLDSDDLLAPWCLSERVEEGIKNPGKDFYLFPTASFIPRGKSYVMIFPDEGDDYMMNFLTLRKMFNISSPLWNGGYIKKLMFDELLPCWQDCDLHIRALAHSKSYQSFFFLPDVFIRKENIAGNRISNTLSLPYAKIQLSYAWQKPFQFLNKGQKLVFQEAYLSNLANFIEIAPIKIAFGFLKLAIENCFFTKVQLFKITFYSFTFHLFKAFHLPNLPYRTREYFGIRRSNKPMNRNLSESEIFRLKKKYQIYPNVRFPGLL